MTPPASAAWSTATCCRCSLRSLADEQSPLGHSEGGFAPLPNLPPGQDCAGKAGARTRRCRCEPFSDKSLGQGKVAPEDRKGRAPRDLEGGLDLRCALPGAGGEQRFEEPRVEVVREYRDGDPEREATTVQSPAVLHGESPPRGNPRVGDLARQVQRDVPPDGALLHALRDEPTAAVEQLCPDHDPGRHT